MPLVGVCPEDWRGPAELSGLKAFMSCATLPRPAHEGVPFPEERASSEADRTVTRDGAASLQLGAVGVTLGGSGACAVGALGVFVGSDLTVVLGARD